MRMPHTQERPPIHFSAGHQPVKMQFIGTHIRHICAKAVAMMMAKAMDGTITITVSRS